MISNNILNDLDMLISDQFLQPTLESIIAIQEKEGSVPDIAGGIVEPWTHVECAMAIDAGRYPDEAKKAYEWLAGKQMSDGSWYATYQYDRPKDTYKVSHAISYIAVGIWYHYLVNNDLRFTRKMWPCVCSAIEYILDMRGPGGEIYCQKNVALCALGY